jgi:hypothetical protein
VTSEDRVTFNDPNNWSGADYALDAVDEVVIHNATVHFEMTSDTSGYLTVHSPSRYVFLRFHARPTTRTERRQILTTNQERLRDHLAALIPNCFGGRTYWSAPWYRRPTSTVRSWRADRHMAGAVFYAVVEEDVPCSSPGEAS